MCGDRHWSIRECRLVQQGGFQYHVDLEDRPVFRFGNGQQSRAVSRVDLTSTALGTLSFYVLDGEASNTPPSLCGRSLRSIGAIMAYDQNLFIYNDKASGSQWMAVKMQPLPSAHVSVDLKGDLTAMDGKWEDVFHASTTVVHADDEGPHFGKPSVMMMSKQLTQPHIRQSLAQKIFHLRQRIRDGSTSTAMCPGRPQTGGCNKNHDLKSRTNQYATWRHASNVASE